MKKSNKTAWRTALHQYKKGLKVRVKLGALDAICEEVRTDRAIGDWTQPEWSNPKWIKFLADSIKQQDYSHTILKGFLQTAEVNLFWKNVPQPFYAIDGANYVCRTYSKLLRNHFGDTNES